MVAMLNPPLHKFIIKHIDYFSSFVFSNRKVVLAAIRALVFTIIQLTGQLFRCTH